MTTQPTINAQNQQLKSNIWAHSNNTNNIESKSQSHRITDNPLYAYEPFNKVNMCFSTSDKGLCLLLWIDKIVLQGWSNGKRTGLLSHWENTSWSRSYPAHHWTSARHQLQTPVPRSSHGPPAPWADNRTRWPSTNAIPSLGHLQTLVTNGRAPSQSIYQCPWHCLRATAPVGRSLLGEEKEAIFCIVASQLAVLTVFTLRKVFVPLVGAATCIK